MLRVRVIEIDDAAGLRGARFHSLRAAIRKLEVGQVVMVKAPTEKWLGKAEDAARVEAKKHGATLRTQPGEERVYMRPRAGTVGLWRESAGHWLYLVKHAQVVPFSGPTAAEMLNA